MKSSIVMLFLAVVALWVFVELDHHKVEVLTEKVSRLDKPNHGTVTGSVSVGGADVVVTIPLAKPAEAKVHFNGPGKFGAIPEPHKKPKPLTGILPVAYGPTHSASFSLPSLEDAFVGSCALSAPELPSGIRWGECPASAPAKVETFSLHGRWTTPTHPADIQREDITPCQDGDWLILTGSGWFCRVPEK